MSRLPMGDCATCYGLIERLRLTPTDLPPGEPDTLTGDHFTIVYELDHHRVAKVTAMRPTPHIYPYNM